MNIQMILTYCQDIECSICFELINNSTKKIIQCNHVFHGACLDRVRTNACPLCRKPFRITLGERSHQASLAYYDAYMAWVNSENISPTID